MAVAIVLAAAAVVAVVATLVVTRRSRAVGDVATSARLPGPDEVTTVAPMTDLDDALRNVIDSSGTPLAQRLDEESDAVDGLRVVDDTGPLLRRALDSVEPHDTSHPSRASD